MIELRSSFLEVKKMALGVLCNKCNAFIRKGNEYYRRKDYLSECFCSRKCLENYVIENLEVRTEIVSNTMPVKYD